MIRGCALHVCVFFHLCFKEAVFLVHCLGTQVAARDAVRFFIRLQNLRTLSEAKPLHDHPPPHPSYCLESKKEKKGGGGLNPSSLVRGFTLPQAIIFPPSLPLLASVPSGSQLEHLLPGFLAGRPRPTQDQLLPDVGGYLKAPANAEPHEQLAGE